MKTTFISLLKNYAHNEALIEDSWNELISHYNGEGRPYHNLSHLENLLQELQQVKPLISDWNTVLFSLFYHDVIYDVKSKTNEEDSADYAEQLMLKIQVPALQINRCKQQILVTKHHVMNEDPDTNFFTDADLSILGAERALYKKYVADVRQEYAIYPDEFYIPGRREVLHHFLQMVRIFKTDYFFEKYEETAKENLRYELDTLL